MLRAPTRVGIPEKAPTGRAARIASLPGEKPRDPNVRIFANESQDRFRIVHEHKRNGRGPLDRTITAARLARLETMFNKAAAAGDAEVVLP